MVVCGTDTVARLTATGLSAQLAQPAVGTTFDKQKVSVSWTWGRHDPAGSSSKAQYHRGQYTNLACWMCKALAAATVWKDLQYGHRRYRLRWINKTADNKVTVTFEPTFVVADAFVSFRMCAILPLATLKCQHSGPAAPVESRVWYSHACGIVQLLSPINGESAPLPPRSQR